MRVLLSAFALGFVGIMVVPATVLVARLTDAQIDRVLRGGLFFCGGILGILGLVGVVALLAWRDERRHNRGDTTGSGSEMRVIQVPYSHLPPQPQLPQPAQWQAGAGSEGEYDFMPEADGRYRFRA